jgi:hypothetical protein
MAELPPEALEFFKKQGSRGGKKSAKGLTPAERTERAQKAAAKSAAVRSKKAAAKKRGTKKGV